MKTFTLTDLHGNQAEIIQQAFKNPILIQKYRQDCFVIMSVEKYEKMRDALKDSRKLIKELRSEK